MFLLKHYLLSRSQRPLVPSLLTFYDFFLSSPPVSSIVPLSSYLIADDVLVSDAHS